MLKDNQPREAASALKRHVSLTTAVAFVMSVLNEMIVISLPSGSTSFDVTLPNASEARQDVDYMIHVKVQAGTGVVTVKSGDESWNAISIALNAVGEFAVCRSNGNAWYTVDSKTA